MRKHFFILFSLLVPLLLFSQDKNQPPKIYETRFVEKAPKIDGVLDDLAWQNTDIATDFVMFKPESGTPQPENLKTEVKIVYDNEAIYFGAYLHDDKPEEIPMEFQTRDNFGNADFFGVSINPQNDGINSTVFILTSTGNQNDAKALPSGDEDWSWNAVWYSEVRVVDDGWIAEMKIPYSALRFSNDAVQTWGVNFHRLHQKTRNQYSWNFIDRDEGGNMSRFDGLLTGLKNIKPPVRLSFSPYASASLEEYKKEFDFGWNAGMDLKYGLTESFTLDATLIPDFGQTAYDDVVLNLGPFEQKYSEKRQFFTEGLDLFSKGNLFYTRRVGNAPIGRYNIILSENEVLTKNPEKVDMFNAIKVSGRMKSGLGIGVFNAITKPTSAIITNSENQSTREVLTEPLANYNVFVIDQQFNKNSSVTLVNTNVLRKGDFRDANVTGLLYDLKTKNNKYGLSGSIAMSNIFLDNMITSGFEGNFEIGKVSGKHQFDIEFSYSDNQYNKNDLGFQRRNNYRDIEAGYSYRIFEPQGVFNKYGFHFWTRVGFLDALDKDLPSYREKANLYTGSRTGIRVWATTKKQLSFGGNMNFGIGQQYDYYEPRTQGRFYKRNPNIGGNLWVSTDFRKTFAFNASTYVGILMNEKQNYISISFSPRYRFNNHMLLQYTVAADKAKYQKAYAAIDNENIIFGIREVMTVENTLSTTYSFNTKSSLGLAFRHYWSPVDYDDSFFLLEDDGSLSASSYSENHDRNVNFWNFDLSYSWEFAPGSQLTVLYRNSLFQENTNPDLSFFTNIDNMFKESLANQLSLKLIYYLDYNKLKF